METQNQAPAPITGFEFTPATPVALTAAAVEKVKEAMAQQKLDGHCLRIAVVGGGCSGFNYDLDLVKDAKPTDVAYDLAGVKVAIDEQSVRFLDGTVIDFVETLQGAGFKFNNPKAKSTCGCGTSFSA
ncbi:HesB/IscA family protein [Vulgatibacter incomptus]|uniref:Putative iron binding protein from the HesB_IscA_SufA family n=1 Tax=Vulgatibacter incomptus TaxID=1391653 RepID=A0A0K1PAR2_9BACT|nr:iron-sulfur cluster assembly accessory protein [Vulgatibacter incomptus]AKU90610.1 putative iron binding protein from the HesB_IscA_SufA family [Vulgatibacter incomptus]